MKTCFKCGKTKPLSDFYKHPGMADGHLGKCKECTKSDSTDRRNKNLESVRAYDRERGKNKERMKSAQEVSKLWRSEDSRRTKCHNSVARALKSGILEKKNCEICGCEKSLAHHEDYDKPLDVVWLCQPCHKAVHKKSISLLKSA